MSRPKRELQKRFVVFCGGDTEYNYIDIMKKRQDVQIALKPINMHGGGYTNFLRKIKTESQTNCLAIFIIVDADRLVKHCEEKDSFLQLAEYCRLQNKKGTILHFLIVNNPDFEYVACLHVPEYRGQEVTRFLQTVLGFQPLNHDIVCPAAFSIHALTDSVFLYKVHVLLACKLASLVRFKDLGFCHFESFLRALMTILASSVLSTSQPTIQRLFQSITAVRQRLALRRLML